MEGLSAQVEIDVRCCKATRRRHDLESSIRRRNRRRIIREWTLHRQDEIFGTDNLVQLRMNGVSLDALAPRDTPTVVSCY